MIDWLTMNLDISHLPRDVIVFLGSRQSFIVKIDSNGQIDWCTPARESIRSDSHQLQMKFGSRLTLQGSPARVDGENNVFGSSDIKQCALKMIRWASRMIELDPDFIYPSYGPKPFRDGPAIPENFELWHCSRIDYNHNFYLGDAATVRQALNHLRNAEGGRYQLRCNAETVYWGSPQSRISGKIYHKGAHLNYQINKEQALAPVEHVELAQGLIRLEIKIGNRYLNDCPLHWTNFTSQYLQKLFYDYFGPLIGQAQVLDMEKDIIEQLEKFAPTKGRAKTAYAHWLQIKQIGFESWKHLVSRSTYYSVKKILLAAGFSYSDFQAQNIVPFRRKPILLDQPITSWDELRKVANR